MKKQWISILLSLATLCAAIPVIPASAAPDTVSFTVTVTGKDTTVGGNTPIVIYPNASNTPRVIPSNQYGFRNAYVMIFDASGKLIEAGGQLVANENGVNGSAQLTVTVPAGGFMIGFTSEASDLLKCYQTAFEGAVLYNATMSIIYDVRAKYDESTKKLSVSYPAENPVTDKTVKFLFVGNSTTYFNGTPIKFKGLCRAAGLDVSVTYCTFGSAYLSEFADPNHERGKAYRRILSEQKFDYVVYQDAGTATQDQITKSLKVLYPLAQKNGAKGLLYMRYADSVDGAVRYFKDYTAIGEAFDMKVSPSAIAYRYCMQERPDISLFADDNAHHSALGSYLIACTWLRTFMNVSPVGNTYTANLDPEAVAYLQKVALRACDEPFDPNGIEPEVYTDEQGVRYPNLALGCSYKPSGAVYKGNWTDTKSNGKPVGKFTDGIAASDGTDGNCGCYTGKDTSVTIDLGKSQQIKRITTDLFGNTGWGIADPSDAKVSFYVSTDGKKFELLGVANADEVSAEGAWKKILYGFTCEEPVEATHVRVRYQLSVSEPEKTTGFCWVSEINAFGVKEGMSDPEPTGDPSETPADPSADPSDEPSGETSVSAPAESTEEQASEPATDTPSTPEEKNAFPIGAIIGIVAACVAAIGAAIALLLRKKKKA